MIPLLLPDSPHISHCSWTCCDRAMIAPEAASGDNPMLDRSGRQLAPSSRGKVGIIYVSGFKKRALWRTEKKAQKQEAQTKNQHEWWVNKDSNHQKHYRVNGMSALLLE